MRWMFVAAAGRLWTPSNLASLRAWYDADDSSTIFDATTGGSLPSSGNDVARWEDKSGGGYHVTQGTAADCPHYVTNTLNGKPVMEFDGSGDCLDASTASDWTFLHYDPHHVFAVWKPGRAANPGGGSATQYGLLSTQTSLAGTDRGASITYRNNQSSGVTDSVAHFMNNGANWVSVNLSGSSELTGGDYSIVGIAGDPANSTAASRSSIRVNGGNSIAANTNNATRSSSDPGRALRIGSTGTNYFLDGFVAEVVICDALLSQSDREKVEGYLAHKWGLETDLPAAHPYESSPPTV